MKTKNIKIVIGLIYLILFVIFFYFLFSHFEIKEITTYKFIQTNIEYLKDLKKSNIILLSIGFIILSIFWVLMLGFASPLVLLAGFIFGKWFGTLLATVGLTLGATFLYIITNYFFKHLVQDKFLDKYKNLEIKFKKNEFIFFLVYRFVGGIPFQIANLLPVMFNVKINNYFFGTLIGITSQVFVLSALGSGIEQIISNNESVPSIVELLFSPEIYIPILGLVFLIIIGLFIKKFFYKN